MIFFAQLQKREAGQLGEATSFGFARTALHTRLSSVKADFQSASFTTRSASASNKINIGKTEKVVKEILFAVANTKNRTLYSAEL
ncbi:MAG: hypothetical protein LC768_12225 [Acidobacteria bacterium]|nr:hypothetical protein [Acidobacteriota bacterium]MCA1639078.1 hypothetical protein [Acidobacteriota bacterium]